MNPVHFRLSTRVSRILCIPFFVVFLLLANGASVSANVATSQRPFTLQSNVSSRAIRPNNLTCGSPPCATNDVQVSGTDIVAGATIAVDPLTPTNLVAGGIDKSCNGTGPESAVFYSSTTGGSAWSSTPSPFCLPGGSTPGGTPAAAFDLNHNSYIATVENNTNIIAEWSQTSSGGCSGTPPPSWCTPVTIAPLAGYAITSNQIHMQIDDHASPDPNQNCIYVAARQLSASSAAITVSYLCNYTWGSSPFTTVPVSIVNYPGTVVVSPSLTTDPNGNVYVTWLQCNPVAGHCNQKTANTLWISESTNHGISWSTPRIITKVVLVPNNCSHSLGCIPGTSTELGDEPSVGFDSANNKLYVAYYTYVGNRTQVMVSSAPSIAGPWVSGSVHPSAHNEFLPWLSVSPSGMVGVTWLELYPSGKYRERGALGPVWTPPFTLASLPSNPNNTWGSGSYIGDYMDNAWQQSGTNCTLYADWTDTRTPPTPAQDQLYVGGILTSSSC